MTSSRLCDAAVLAAGHGKRIGASTAAPKPLTPLLGRPLIDHVLRSLAEGGVHRVAVAVRAEHRVLSDYLREQPQPIDVVVVARDTDGGTDSLLGLTRHLTDDFVLCTADGLFPAAELPQLVASPSDTTTSMTLGVVTRTASSGADVGVVLAGRHVVALGKHLRDTPYVAEGPMWCTRRLLEPKAIRASRNVRSLSTFLGVLIGLGYSAESYSFSWAMDVDDFCDLRRAEAQLTADAS